MMQPRILNSEQISRWKRPSSQRQQDVNLHGGMKQNDMFEKLKIVRYFWMGGGGGKKKREPMKVYKAIS